MSVFGLINYLCAAAIGLIDRQQYKRDGRVVFAQLNKEGGKALKDTWAIYSKEILKIFEPALTQSEGLQIEALLGKIIEQVKSAPLIKIGGK